MFWYRKTLRKSLAISPKEFANLVREVQYPEMPQPFPPPLRNEIEEIRGVFLLERMMPGLAFVTSSPPGHLLHLVIEGEVCQRCNGREHHLRAGDMLWYHESECVEGVCLAAPWRFYSVVFHAPSLPPPDFTSRVARPARKMAMKHFADLLRAWNDASEGASRRALRCHAALSEILLLHHPVGAAGAAPADWLVQLWWNVENQVRQNLSRPYTLRDLAGIARTSAATIHRASMAAVQTPPVRRIKSLRLEMAYGLLVYSQMSVTEIAGQTGYERVNELSRDFRKAYRAAPSEVRRARHVPDRSVPD